ncbi:ABC transporter ATP-binding protein [Paenibacillus sp. Leaf72]|uniref:ABC transporter ATP-binding protein n=1 Tax=Paenibacillus sp. Leaf72 TaxID=1736234 RepID=UPI00070186EA|nr:ABC transporter ATP-binding protein [Paenibacillus sp. Leaf72]KQN97174.1 ABC transporter [Paenibacillus sp. Leaf72]
MSNETAIHIKKVELRRDRFQLGPLSLEVPKGYVTAIVGPNGSGKSSTFRMLLDLIKPDKGELSVLGHSIADQKDIDWKNKIGYVPELFGSHENKLRASDKTDFVQKWYPNWDVNLYREILRMFEVDDSIRLGKMSKGTRRKYEFALVLAHHPELLLLDEPSSGFDPLAWRSMMSFLHNYMNAGERTILMASHIVDEVKRLADYIVFMSQGRILGMYEKDELLSSWHMFYVNGRELEGRDVRSIPGQCVVEDAGCGNLRIITRQALETERWLEQASIEIMGRQALDLDDILAVLIQQDRQHIRA